MRRTLSIAVVVVLFSAFVCLALKNRMTSRDTSTRNRSVSTSEEVPSDPTAAPEVATLRKSPAEAPTKEPPVLTLRGTETEQRAYRFVLTSGKLALETANDIHGDFHPRRGRTAWQPGMLCCRLLDARHHVLAEETVPAPDHVCVVLDPNSPGPDGKPQPAMLSPTGPVVFQVRLPKVESATQMKVYRIAGAQRARFDEEPLGQLMATIPLAR